MKRSPPRGQTLVLMAISLLLLTLMVTLTLSIGAKVREKMEVQAVADAAAYSNAAVTARVYNEIALLSRAQIGHMVSMAAVQSLINWSTIYRAHVAAVAAGYGLMSIWHGADAARCCNPWSGCQWMCGCSIAASAQAGIKGYRALMGDIAQATQFEAFDQAAGTQSLRIQEAAMRLHGVQIIEYARLMREIGGQHLAQEIVNDASASSRVPGEWDAPSSGSSVSDREIGFFTGATTPFDILNSHHVFAAMGSRGFSFLTGRVGMPALVIQNRLQMLYVQPPDQVTVINQGSSYFATTFNHGAAWPLVNGKYSWTDDHGANILSYNHTFPPCPRYTTGLATASLLSSTDATDPNDTHAWIPFTFALDRVPAIARHTLGRCLRCPSMWPTFIDYNFTHMVDEEDNYGQPKNFAVIQRDYAVRAASGQPVDPWNLAFRFRFSPARESGFDNRGLVLADGVTDISKQTGLSAGIAYYHRKGHWKEPPNLLNPYWRATLVPLTTDAEGRGDVSSTLRDVGTDWASDAYQALRNQNYEGGP